MALSRGAGDSWSGRALLGAPATALEALRRELKTNANHARAARGCAGTLVVTVGTVAILGERQRRAVRSSK